MPPKKPVVGRGAPGTSRPAPAKSNRATGAKGVVAPNRPGKGANVAPAKKNTKPVPPKPKGPTKEDLAQIVIAKYIRRYLAKSELRKLKVKKQEYDELIDKLQNQAFLDMVNAEREEADRQFQRDQEVKRKKVAAKKRQTGMLEAAFDDEIDEMEKLVKQCLKCCDEDGIDDDEIGLIKREEIVFKLIDCSDANDNRPLSEAGAGGATGAIEWLLERGADPNSIGQFCRTPLYRAAFAGHVDAVRCLLEGGSDPRIQASDHNTPAQVSANAEAVTLLENWDISKTEEKLVEIEKAKEERNNRISKRKVADTQTKENHVADLEKKLDTLNKAARKAYEELEKRITEHDTCVQEGKIDILHVTEQTIHDAEMDLEIARVRVNEMKITVQRARLELREGDAEEAEKPGVKCAIKELEDVILRDVGNRIKESKKQVLMIEPGRSNQAGTFLRYRDTNYLMALSEKDMSPESLRTNLLGALRYGKLFVIDFDFMDLFDAINQYFDMLKPGLYQAIIDGEITKADYYRTLVKESDPKEYQTSGFSECRIESFHFCVYTRFEPDEQYYDIFYPITIVPPS